MFQFMNRNVIWPPPKGPAPLDLRPPEAGDLTKAVKEGKVHDVKRLIASGANLEERDEVGAEYFTSMSHACASSFLSDRQDVSGPHPHLGCIHTLKQIMGCHPPALATTCRHLLKGCAPHLPLLPFGHRMGSRPSCLRVGRDASGWSRHC